MKSAKLRILLLQPPDASDWIVVMVRSLLLIMLTSLILRGWIERTDHSVAIALSLALFFNGIAIIAHWRGLSLRIPSLIVDSLWMWLWMFAVNERAIYFLPMLLLLVIVAGMWYRLSGAFLAAGFCSIFWLAICYRTNLLTTQTWVIVSSLSFVFLSALLSGYMAEVRLYAEHMLARYRQEMLISRYLHEHMMPKEMPSISGWQLARLCRPARAIIGGDFHDFIQRDDGSCVILLGDVSGKGFDAQVKVPMVKSAVKLGMKSNVETNLSMALRTANEILINELPEEAFATAVLAHLRQDDGCAHIANAGHTPVLLLRSTGIVEQLPASGPPLRAIDNVNYHDEQISLQDGDALIFLTDGVIDVRNKTGEPYGLQRLEGLLHKLKGASARKIAERILEDVLQFGAHITDDDITIIVAKYEPKQA